MKTFSASLTICAGNSPVTGEFSHKDQWRGALTFSLICAWMNVWVNNREADDLRRHRAHYDITVMSLSIQNANIIRKCRKKYFGMTMYPFGLPTFQRCCFRLTEWWPNSTHWTWRLFLARFCNYSPWLLLPPDSLCPHFPYIYYTFYLWVRLSFSFEPHDDVINCKHFRVTGPLCGELTGHRWIPLTKASDTELWCFLWSVPW